MPAAVSYETWINDVRYVDGCSSKPHVLDKAYEEIESTHVLVLTNQDQDDAETSFIDKFAHNTLFRHRTNPVLRRVSNNRGISRSLLFRKFSTTPLKPTLLVWGDGSVKSYEKNKNKILKTMNRSQDWWRELLVK